MKDNQGFLKQAIIDAGGTAYPMPDPLTAMPNNQNELMFFATGMTLLDAFAKDAPITLSDAFVAYNAANPPKQNEDNSPTYGVIYALLAEMRYSYAEAMLAERVK